VVDFYARARSADLWPAVEGVLEKAWSPSSRYPQALPGGMAPYKGPSDRF